MEDFEEGQIVLCTVDKIAGTTVFVKIEGDGEGTITTSEPLRIVLHPLIIPKAKTHSKLLFILVSL